MTAQPATVIPTSTFWLLWAIPPIIVLIILFMQFMMRPQQQVERQSRKQSRALKSAIAQLTQAQQQSPNQIYSMVEQIIVQYIADTYHQDKDSINQLNEVISDLSVSLQKRTLICLEQARSGQYAPVTADDANKLLRRTYQTLQLIEDERA